MIEYVEEIFKPTTSYGELYFEVSDDWGDAFVSMDYKYLPTQLQDTALKISFDIDENKHITSSDTVVAGYFVVTSTFGKFYLETYNGAFIRFDYKYLPSCYIGRHVNVVLEVL